MKFKFSHPKPATVNPPAEPVPVAPEEPADEAAMIAKAKSMVSQGVSVRAVCEATGLKPRQVFKRIEREGWASPSRVRTLADQVKACRMELRRKVTAGELTDCEKAVLAYYDALGKQVTIVTVDKLGNPVSPETMALVAGDEIRRAKARKAKSGDAGKTGREAGEIDGSGGDAEPGNHGAREPEGEGELWSNDPEEPWFGDDGEEGNEGDGVHGERSESFALASRQAKPRLSEVPALVAKHHPLSEEGMQDHDIHVAAMIREAVIRARAIGGLDISKPSDLSTLDALYRRVTGQESKGKAPAGPSVNVQVNVLSSRTRMRPAKPSHQSVTIDVPASKEG